MAIVGFWSGSEKETGQTASAAAVATCMAIEHNMRILLVDATFNDDTLERCFWNIKKQSNELTKQLNKGKMDISSGAEGLVSAVASNKVTPEIITNYTRVVFKNRLDVLCGLKTKIPEDFNKSLMLYKDLINIANKYYDVVIVDLEKSLRRDTTRALVDQSNILIYNITKNLKQADDYLEIISDPKYNTTLLKREKIIPLLGNVDENALYNTKNVSRYIGEKKEICSIPYNVAYLKASNEAGVAQYFLSNKLSNKTNDKNSEFILSVQKTCLKIIDKMKELKFKV